MSEIHSIAITGKGGTGKTMIATLMIRSLVKRYPGQLLAVDADSAMSLPYTLGLPVEKTISQMRAEIAAPGQMRKKMQNVPLADWIDTILSHGEGFDLLTMGRPEEPGCFCAINDVLREGIEALSDRYKIIIIDGEAGPEQINRRVLSSIDTLIVISDMSARSLVTSKGILDIARGQRNGIKVKKAGLILNRVRDDKPDEELLKSTGVDVIGWVPEDKQLNEYDRQGKSLLELPEDSPCVKAVDNILSVLLNS